MRPALAAAAMLASLAVAPALAADPLDGAWRVLIMTEKGTCDQVYAYPLTIKDRKISYAGQTAARVAGAIEPDGDVKVRISLGDQHADGIGRLSAKAGAGTWVAGNCSGKWRASRTKA